MTTAEWKKELRRNLVDIFPDTTIVLEHFSTETIGGQERKTCGVEIDGAEYKIVEGFEPNSFILIELFGNDDAHIYTLRSERWEEELCKNLKRYPNLFIIPQVGIYLREGQETTSSRRIVADKKGSSDDDCADDVIRTLQTILGK